MVNSKKYTGVYYNELENGDKSYYVRFKVKGKRYDINIGKHSERIREAYCSKKRAELMHEAKNGLIINDKIGLDELASKYHNTKMTNAAYQDMLSRYDYKIKPHFKNKQVSSITEDDIYALQKALMKTRTGSKGKGDRLMANATVNYYVQQVSSILNYAVLKGYLRGNVARNIKNLKEDNARDRYLDREELDELVEAVEHNEDLLMFVELSISTGGRMGAVMQTKKKDFNVSNKTVNLADEKGQEHYTAFLNERVLKLLKRKIANLSPNDSIYSSNQRRMQRQMKRILDQLFNDGLDVDDRKNRVVVHTLRHSFASHLAINGTPIFTIQNLLNHKDISQTMRYAKLAPDSGRENVESIWT